MMVVLTLLLVAIAPAYAMEVEPGDFYTMGQIDALNAIDANRLPESNYYEEYLVPLVIFLGSLVKIVATFIWDLASQYQDATVMIISYFSSVVVFIRLIDPVELIQASIPVIVNLVAHHVTVVPARLMVALASFVIPYFNIRYTLSFILGNTYGILGLVTTIAAPLVSRYIMKIVLENIENDEGLKTIGPVQYRFKSWEDYHKYIQQRLSQTAHAQPVVFDVPLPEEVVRHIQEYAAAARTYTPNNYVVQNGDHQVEITATKMIEDAFTFEKLPPHIRNYFMSLVQPRVYESSAGNQSIAKVRIGDCRPADRQHMLPALTRMQMIQLPILSTNSHYHKELLYTDQSKSYEVQYVCCDLNSEIKGNATLKKQSLDTILMHIAKRCCYLITANEYRFITQYYAPILVAQCAEANLKALEHSIKYEARRKELEDEIERKKVSNMLATMIRRATRYARSRDIYKLWKTVVVTLATLLLAATIIISFLIAAKIPRDPWTLLPDVVYGDIPHVETKVSPKPLKEGFQVVKNKLRPRDPTYRLQRFYKTVYSEGLQSFDLHNPVNVVEAVRQRVARSNITDEYHPDFHLMNEFADELAKELHDQVRPYDQLFNMTAMREYIEARPNYSASQKRSILAVLDKYATYSPQEMMLHARFHSFIKDEMYPKNNRPRSIMACDDIVKVIMGVIYNEIGEAYFKRKQTIKLSSILNRTHVIEERLGGYNYVYQTDHTAFECSATREIQENIELRVYKEIYPQLSWYFDQLAKDEYVTTGFGPDVAAFIIPTSRWSGAPNTSLGNSITNEVLIKMIIKHFDVKARYLVEGDDGLIVTDKPLNETLVLDYARKNGFDLKLESKEGLNTAGFLSLVWDRNHTRDVVDRWRYLVKTVQMRHDDIRKIGYWNMLSARLMSAVVNIPGSRMIYEAYLNSLRWGVPTDKLNYYNYLITVIEQQLEVEVKNDLMVMKGVLRPQSDKVYEIDNDRYHVPATLEADIIARLRGDQSSYIQALGDLVDVYYTQGTGYPTQADYLKPTPTHVNTD
jgi:hypothetical protein